MTDSEYREFINVFNKKINNIYKDCQNAIDIKDFLMINYQLEILSYMMNINNIRYFATDKSQWQNLKIYQHDIYDLWDVIHIKINEFKN